MTRDDIIRMAHEAGLGDGLLTGKSVDGESGIWINLMSVRSVLERFAELVAAAEREALLSAVDEIERENRQFPVSCDVFRNAIRARGEK